ncbi:hypothetical protein [Nocardia sp. NPDC050718]|uniref:hypothetical protein n=1 Tax=Nocardia sp. NPDC050718 TaxID=3155788 RepID=UPI0033CDD52D
MVDPDSMFRDSSTGGHPPVGSRNLLDSAVRTRAGGVPGRHGVVRLHPDEHWGGTLQEILRDVREEAVVAVCAPRQMKRYYHREALVLRDLLEAGRRVRVLYSRNYAITRDPVPGPLPSTIAPHTKVTGIEFPNTIIIDRRVAVLWNGSDDPRPDALLVREPSLLRALHQFAATTWDSAVGLPGCPVRSGLELDAMSIAVLEALGAGLKDEVAARRLSVSLRTYRRHVAAVMVRLEVDTRYQLGARASELGFRSRLAGS